MASPKLKELSQLIESQGKNSHAKFFLYTGLLSAISSPEGKFNTAIPTVGHGFLSTAKPMDLGILPVDFDAKLKAYNQAFWAMKDATTYSRFMRDCRIADQAFILDHMLKHLNATQIDADPEVQRQLNKSIDFDQSRTGIHNFIETINNYNTMMLEVSDDRAHGYASFALSTGLLLTSLFITNIALSICLPLAALGLYVYANKCIEHSNELVHSYKQSMSQNMKATIEKAPRSVFFAKAITKPAMLSMATALEDSIERSEDEAEVKSATSQLRQALSAI